jgi:hypothetical protein
MSPTAVEGKHDAKTGNFATLTQKKTISGVSICSKLSP